jgi:hypothetical protein
MPHDEYVPAVERSRRVNVLKCFVLFQGLPNGRRLAAARFRAGARHYRKFGEDHGNVFNEYRICEIGCRLEPFDGAASFGQAPLVFFVLCARKLEIYDHARLMGQFTVHDCGADRSRNCHEHQG